MLIPFGTIRKQLTKNPTYFPKIVPDEFCLSTGHINFFIPKILYIVRRLVEVNKECALRNFESSMAADLTGIPARFLNDWECKLEDSIIVRERIVDRIKNPLKATKNYHKYYGSTIASVEEFCFNIINSKLSV